MIAGLGFGACALAAPGAPLSASPGPDAEPLARLVAQASTDLERGELSLHPVKGAARLVPADKAYTAVIENLTPVEGALDDAGRSILARALDGRAQTGLLRGRLKAADSDLAQLVRLDPGYAPDPARASRKAIERFKKIREPLVAFVTLQLDPPEAEIEWNGRAMASASRPFVDLPVLSGPFSVRARRACFEEKEVTGDIAAGEKKIVVVTLDATDRAVRFETTPAGFDVDLDGTTVGRTAAPSAAAPSASPGSDLPVDASGDLPPSESAGLGNEDRAGPGASAREGSGSRPEGVLDLACVPPGNHAYLIHRDCYADTRGSLTVEIDLLDHAPIVVPAVAPRRLATLLSVRSDTPGAALFMDGKAVGPLPVRNLPLCPARKRIEVRAADRILWSETRELGDGDITIEARRRPTLALVLGQGKDEAPTEAVADEVRRRAASLTAFNRDDGPHPDLRFEAARVSSGGTDRLSLRLAAVGTSVASTDLCALDDAACIDRFFTALDAPWPGAEVGTKDPRSAGAGSAVVPPPGTSPVPLPRLVASRLLDAAVLPAGEERNVSLMSLAAALIGAGAHRQALVLALDDSRWADDVPGPAARGSAAFLAGICHLALGAGQAAREAFERASNDARATLWTPDGLPVAPLARIELAAGSPSSPAVPAPHAPPPAPAR